MKIILILLLLFSFYPHPTNAKNLGDEMTDFYDSLGGTSNITNPQFVKGQKAGYLSLGGIQYRSNSQNTQLASMQLPSLRAGCGGIDFFAGGMSFINSDQLLAMIKSIGSSSAGLLLQMAIDQVTPQLGSVIKYMQNLARQINDLNINSCQAASALLKDPSSTMQSAVGQACKTGGTALSFWQDASDAFAKCSNGGKAVETANSLPKSIKDQAPVENINIAWKALKDSGFINDSSNGGVDLAELMMTLSGTIVIRGLDNDNSTPEIIPFFPASYDHNLVQTLLEGGTYKGLKCDDTDKCLNPTKSNNINITNNKSYLGKVKAAIDKIKEAIKTDDPSKMDDNAYKLLSFSALPLYKMLNVQTAYYPDSGEADGISEYIALDILYGFLEKENEIIRRAAARYNTESYRKVFASWFDNQDEIKADLNARRQKLSAKFNDYYKMLERTATIEKALSKDATQKVSFGGRR
jgi:conjugative transfer pilus assembly protein TraH